MTQATTPITGTNTRSCHCSGLSMSRPSGSPPGRKPRNPQQTSAVVTKAGSRRTAARRRTAGRSAAIAAAVRIRVAAKSPSFSQPAMPSSGSEIVPEFAVIGVYARD